MSSDLHTVFRFELIVAGHNSISRDGHKSHSSTFTPTPSLPPGPTSYFLVVHTPRLPLSGTVVPSGTSVVSYGSLPSTTLYVVHSTLHLPCSQSPGTSLSLNYSRHGTFLLGPPCHLLSDLFSVNPLMTVIISVTSGPTLSQSSISCRLTKLLSPVTTVSRTSNEPITLSVTPKFCFLSQFLPKVWRPYPLICLTPGTLISTSSSALPLYYSSPAQFNIHDHLIRPSPQGRSTSHKSILLTVFLDPTCVDSGRISAIAFCFFVPHTLLHSRGVQQLEIPIRLLLFGYFLYFLLLGPSILLVVITCTTRRDLRTFSLLFVKVFLPVLVTLTKGLQIIPERELKPQEPRLSKSLDYTRLRSKLTQPLKIWSWRVGKVGVLRKGETL